MNETNGFASFSLLPQNSGSMNPSDWLSSLRAIAERLTQSTNGKGLDPQILDIFYDGLWITDSNDTITYANNAITHIFGVSKNEIIGTRIISSHSSISFQHFIPYYFKAKDHRCPILYNQIAVLTAQGQSSRLTGWIIPRYTKSKSFNGIICSVRDLTATTKSSHWEATCDALCNNSRDSIYCIDPKGIILYLNRNPSSLFPKAVVGSSLLSLIPSHHGKELESCLKQVEKTQSPHPCFLDCPTPSGSIEYFEAKISPFRPDGKLVGFIINLVNITRQKVLEMELSKQKSNLEETNITLKVLLKRIEKERLLFQENLSTNILCNIEPYMNKLKQSNLDKNQKKTLDILDQNIKDMASPLIYSVMTMNLRLTPAEMQVSNFIRQGYSSKEIAELLNISPATIDKHRKNIRKKLGITNKKQNLRSVLSSLPS